jgi:uncharacterized membrane protein YjfL (UPF0719 family)
VPEDIKEEIFRLPWPKSGSSRDIFKFFIGNNALNTDSSGGILTMELVNAFIGLIQLVIAIILAVVALYIGYSTFSRMTKGMDEQQELARGNVAVGIIIAAIFFAIAFVVQSCVAGISIGISNALEGDWISLIAAFILILGIILAIAAIYIALNILDRHTKGIDEYAELKKGNVAVALIMAGVIVATAIIIQSGVIGITSALI